MNSKLGASYQDSPDLIKSKKIAVNPITKNDNKCFQYSLLVELNHENTENILKE